MNSYKILSHMADVKLEVQSDKVSGLFSSALSGMNQLLKKNFCKKTKSHSSVQTISLESNDQTNLLIDFLSDVLTLSHIHKNIYCRVNFKILTKNKLVGKVYGSNVKSFDEDIKAVSYHGAEIIKDKQGNYRINILLDI